MGVRVTSLVFFKWPPNCAEGRPVMGGEATQALQQQALLFGPYSQMY